MKKILCVLILLGGLVYVPKNKSNKDKPNKDNYCTTRVKCEDDDCWDI